MIRTNVTILVTVFRRTFEVSAIWNGSRLVFPTGYNVATGERIPSELAKVWTDQIERIAHNRIGGFCPCLDDQEWPLSTEIRM